MPVTAPIAIAKISTATPTTTAERRHGHPTGTPPAPPTPARPPSPAGSRSRAAPAGSRSRVAAGGSRSLAAPGSRSLAAAVPRPLGRDVEDRGGALDQARGPAEQARVDGGRQRADDARHGRADERPGDAEERRHHRRRQRGGRPGDDRDQVDVIRLLWLILRMRTSHVLVLQPFEVRGTAARPAGRARPARRTRGKRYGAATTTTRGSARSHPPGPGTRARPPVLEYSSAPLGCLA